MGPNVQAPRLGTRKIDFFDELCQIKSMGQLALQLPRWGGKRSGAGRKPKGVRAGVWHVVRGRVRKGPVHVTWRMCADTWSLSQGRCFKPIERAFWAACDRHGMRITHFSVQGNHIHLIVEVEDKDALAKGMQGLGVRIARALNRVMSKKGKRLADRYHAHVLKTPSEVRNAVEYVLRNHLKHRTHLGHVDEFSSENYPQGMAPVARWQYWLMKRVFGDSR
jgi:REP element-mobilizing transposase RayT